MNRVERRVLFTGFGTILTFAVFLLLFLYNPLSDFIDAIWLLMGMFVLVFWVWESLAYIVTRETE